jgi:hypothetical protein
MACPHFDPGERLAGSSGSLGDLYSGQCRADNSARPDEQTLADRCNLGYARGRCLRFPENGGPDAVRFSVSRDDLSGIRILYSFERDHRPFAHGALEYSAESGVFTELLAGAPLDDAALERLAAAYVRSYLRRTR